MYKKTYWCDGTDDRWMNRIAGMCEGKRKGGVGFRDDPISKKIAHAERKLLPNEVYCYFVKHKSRLLRMI